MLFQTTLIGVGFSDILRTKIKFLNSFPIFSHWNDTKLGTLLHYFEIKTFKKGDILYKENEPASSIFFIKQGEVEVSLIMI